MKNNIEHYPHHCNSHNHWKFKLLRAKYGWAGEGKFWALHNEIGLSENCKLNLKDKYKINAISGELGFTISEFKEFLTYLLKDCRLLKRKDDFLTTDIVQQVFTVVMHEREKSRNRKRQNSGGDIESSGELNENTGGKNNKVKESKVKKSKEYIYELYGSMVSEYPSLNNDAFHKIYFDWIEYRFEIKKPIKSVKTIKLNLEMLSKEPNPEAVINQSIDKSWQGLFPVKNNYEHKQNNYGKKSNATGEERKSSRIERNLKAADELLQRVTSE